MHKRRDKTRVQDVGLVRMTSNLQRTSSQQIPVVPHEPNKAAVKQSVYSTRIDFLKTDRIAKTQTGSSDKLVIKNVAYAHEDKTKQTISELEVTDKKSTTDCGISFPPKQENCTLPILETPQSETNDFLTSHLSLQWSPTSCQSEEQCVSSSRIGFYPPMPKLKPINVVDPVLSRPERSYGDSIETPEEVSPTSRLEVERLQKELESQVKVNAELKKMLVASMGDDLEYRMERLLRDRAQLSEEIGHYTRRVTEDYEELDKVSIQADMWRSKYLASRVMVDELSGMKEVLQRTLESSEAALIQMIEERHEVNRIIVETYGYLNHMREAFEPANATCPMPTISCNTLMLADLCKNQAENIHVRLLPGGKSSLPHYSRFIKFQPSQGETMALKMVTKPGVVTGNTHPPVGNMQVPRVESIPRFHPLTRYENFTISGCSNCQGEVFVV